MPLAAEGSPLPAGKMIELRNVHKNFDQVAALTGVSLKAGGGSIHGIVGENGAGKSTLMKVLTGFISKSGGEIILNGRKTTLRSPEDARRLGIGMLYQEPLDFPQLSVVENFMAGAASFAPVAARRRLADLSQTFGFHLNPSDRVEDLTLGERQQLELLRLIAEGARILILDEPTTGISEKQQASLFAALRRLRNDGATIILVSHKLDEVELLCDAVTVLRHGRVVADYHRPFNRDLLLHDMFDTLPERQRVVPQVDDSKVVLEFDRVVYRLGRSTPREISLVVRAGEVVGLAGIDGSGQGLFLKTACGLATPLSGRVLCFGHALDTVDTKKQRSTVFLPSDRLTEGLFPAMTIREHHLLTDRSARFITPATGRDATRRAIATHSIKGLPETAVEDLSGGNQQRLLLSLIPPEARLILLENPTRGLDVQSAAWTWRHLQTRLASDGAILFASPDLEELMHQASRILVFYQGEIVLDTPTEKTSAHQLSRAITGQVESV